MEEHSAGFLSGVVTVALAIVGVATLAVVLSRKSNTAAVIQNAGSAIANNLEAAEAPVTGAAASPITSYAGTSSISDLGEIDGSFSAF